MDSKYMRNLIIVDDEYFMQDFLKNMIDWKSIGVLLVDIASDGEQALEIIQNNKIDIVITDVKMPKMDGLTLIEEAVKCSPKTKFFVLSGYDDFDYVRKSYRVGAVDYFLKTELTPEDIYNAIGGLEFEFEKSGFIPNNDEFNDSDYMVGWKENQIRLNSVIKGDILYHLPTPFFIIVLKFHKFDYMLSSYWENDLEHFKYAIINVVGETLGSTVRNDVFFTDTNDLVAIVSIVDKSIIQQIFREVSSNIMKCFFMKVSGGISETVSDLHNVNAAFLQAFRLSNSWYTTGKGKLSEHSAVDMPSQFTIEEDKVGILKSVLSGMSISNTLQNIPRILIDNGIEEEKGRQIFDSYYTVLLHFAIENNIFSYLENDFEIYNSELKIDGDLNEQNQWLKKIMVAIAEKISISDNSSDVAIKYIAKNYMKDISLTDVANHIFVTPSYLSRMFYKWTGYNFAKYLNIVRINKAVELMKDTNYKIFEISELVGFANTEHFSRTFKKITGVSPKDYLNNKK